MLAHKSHNTANKRKIKERLYKSIRHSAGSWLKLALVLALVTVPLVELFARAGGAGGGSSHSSGGGSYSSGGSSGGGDIGFLLYAIVDLFSLLIRTIGPVPTLIIVAVIVALIVIARNKSKHDNGNAYKNLSRVWKDHASTESTGKPQGWTAFSKRNPGFDEAGFLQKAQSAFFSVQDAWSKQDLAPVRRFISDGVYQRFNTQFAMMRLLKQRNQLSNIHVRSLRIDRAESDGAYDILHVGIQASMYDEFYCATNTALNQSGEDSFTEFWSFLRKQKRASGPATTQKTDSGDGTAPGSATSDDPYKDLYQNDNCPSCGAPLPKDLGERGQCPYCNSFVNSGEYDWVLSEITQADDYAADRALIQSGAISGNIPAIQKEDPNFSIQLAEDKASNAFLQILSAKTQGDAKVMRRFVNDRAYEKILESFNKGRTVVFNRLYLNKVTLSAISQDSEKNHLDFNIVMSSQRAELQGDSARNIDPAMRQERWILRMSRNRNAYGAKGSVYMHQCPNCGGQIKDSLDLTCSYCGQLYNAGAQEWVVEDLLPAQEYRSAQSNTTAQTETRRVRAQVSQETFERLYDVRDYAFNNLMVMIAADGVFADEERQLAEQAARKLGYSKVPDLEALFQMAANGRMSLKMPLDSSRHGKIISLMENAALADGEMSPDERRILDYLKTNFGANVS